VAGIVHGVAPAASILDYDLGESSFSGSGILAAIDEVIDRKDEFNTVAMNMSFGSGANTASCNSTSYLATPIATARAAGILSAVASGNSASATEIAAPACVDEAVAVGALAGLGFAPALVLGLVTLGVQLPLWFDLLPPESERA
jgi:subtilisin family serine protease